MVAEAEPAHTGEVISRLRAKAGLSLEEVAARAAVEPAQLASLEAGIGVEDLGYDDVLRLVRATQPPRPDWWDEGHEHDLNLGAFAMRNGETETDRQYWARIESVREDIHRHFEHGRRAS